MLYGNSNRSKVYKRNSRVNKPYGSMNQPRFPLQSSYKSGRSTNSNQWDWRPRTSGGCFKLRCNICESTYLLSYNCPVKGVYTAGEEDDSYDVALHQSNLITGNDFKVGS